MSSFHVMQRVSVNCKLSTICASSTCSIHEECACVSTCFWPVAAVCVGPVCCSMGACFKTGEDDDPLQRSLAARCISERFQVIYSLLSHADRQLDRYAHTVRQARNTQTDIQTGLDTSRLPSIE